MRRAAALILLAALAGCEEMATNMPDDRPSEAGTVDHAMCLLGFHAVPLKELMTGHHLVTATLNGRSGAFVLDTGANASVLHAPLAGRFGVGEGSGFPGAAVGLGGGMEARQVGIDSLEIGGIPIRRNRVMTADLSQVANVLRPLAREDIYGIIGQDVMKEHRAVIDVARPVLYLIAADADPRPVPAERCAGATEPGESAVQPRPGK